MVQRVAVVGAGGFVGRALCPWLAGRGHEVVAIARAAPRFPDIEGRAADLSDPAAAAQALAGVSHAIYLLHSMKSGGEFPEMDRRLAETFAAAAAGAGVQRIVYLGGLGTGDLSDHLSSRQDVGRVLGGSGIPVAEFRAAVVLGSGSISFEMLRYLSERLPAMTCPRWVRTRIQPIAKRDVLAYLEEGLTCDPGVYEIGGADVTTYKEMIQAYACVRGLRRRFIVDVPWLTLKLSAYWVDLVTPVDRTISHALIQSLSSEVVVTNPAAAALPVRPMGLRESLQAALDEQAASLDHSLLEMASGRGEGLHVVRSTTPAAGCAGELLEDLGGAGGDLHWYGTPTWWRLRMVLGALLGEHFPLSRPAALETGATVDWWRVVDRSRERLVLRAVQWRAGDAWLGYEVDGERLVQVAAFRGRGAPGLLYWSLLAPVHGHVFHAMAARRIRRAEVRAGRRAPVAPAA